MKEKMFMSIIVGIGIVTSIPICNNYILPVFRHKEMMDIIDSLKCEMV